MKILRSKIDHSINNIFDIGEGFFESRFVQRKEDYVIIYLSTYNGCNKSCRFCHLTQTGQTQEIPATLDDILIQANTAFMGLNTVSDLEKITKVHFNFMARGEPLEYNTILNGALYYELQNLAYSKGIFNVRFNISSILPKSMSTKRFSSYFHKDYDTHLYHSLYSINEEFRKRWIPKANNMSNTSYYLKIARERGAYIRFHWAYIKNENDSLLDTNNIVRFIEGLKLPYTPKINIIEYNPPYPGHSYPSDKEVVNRNVKILSEIAEVKLINKVGFDVKASCGMFVN